MEIQTTWEKGGNVMSIRNHLSTLYSKTRSQKGITFIEVLISSVVLSVITAGALMVYNTSQSTLTNEQQKAEIRSEVEQIKQYIFRQLKKVYGSNATTELGFVLGEDGDPSGSTPNPVTSAPDNAFGETTVYPDKMEFVTPTTDSEDLRLAADYSPTATTISILTNFDTAPSLSVGDIIIVYTEKFLLFEKVTAFNSGADPTLPMDITVEHLDATNIPFKFGSMENTGGGTASWHFDDRPSMSTVLASQATVRKVDVNRIFCSPRADGSGELDLIHQKNTLASSGSTYLNHRGLHDCQFRYLNTLGDVENWLDKINNLSSKSKLISAVSFEFKASVDDQKVIAKDYIDLLEDTGLASKNDVVRTEALPVNNPANESMGHSIFISNVESGAGAYANIQLVSQKDGSNVITGTAKVTDANGNTINISGLDSDVPYTRAIQNPYDGKVYLTKVREYNGTSWEGKATLISPNLSGNIDNTSTTQELTFPGVTGSIVGMSFHRDTSGATDYMKAWIMTLEERGSSLNTVKVHMLQRDESSASEAFSWVASHQVHIGAGNSQHPVGLAIVDDPTDADKKVVVFATRPARTNNSINGTGKPSAIYGFQIHDTDGTAVSAPVAGITPYTVATITDLGSVETFQPVYSDKSSTTAKMVAYAGPYNSHTIEGEQLNTLVGHAINGTATPIDLRISRWAESTSTQPRCRHKITGDNLDADWAAANNDKLIFYGPTILGMSALDDGSFKAQLASGYDDLSINFNPTNNAWNEGRIKANLVAHSSKKLSRTLVNYANAIPRRFGTDELHGIILTGFPEQQHAPCGTNPYLQPYYDSSDQSYAEHLRVTIGEYDGDLTTPLQVDLNTTTGKYFYYESADPPANF